MAFFFLNLLLRLKDSSMGLDNVTEAIGLPPYRIVDRTSIVLLQFTAGEQATGPPFAGVYVFKWISVSLMRTYTTKTVKFSRPTFRELQLVPGFSYMEYADEIVKNHRYL